MGVNVIETYNELSVKTHKKITKEGNKSLVLTMGKNNACASNCTVIKAESTSFLIS